VNYVGRSRELTPGKQVIESETRPRSPWCKQPHRIAGHDFHGQCVPWDDLRGAREGALRKSKKNMEFCCFPPWGEELRPSPRQRPRACLLAIKTYGGKCCGDTRPRGTSHREDSPTIHSSFGKRQQRFRRNCLALKRSNSTSAVHLSLTPNASRTSHSKNDP
jgi:hypothetical protein